MPSPFTPRGSHASHQPAPEPGSPEPSIDTTKPQAPDPQNLQTPHPPHTQGPLALEPVASPGAAKDQKAQAQPQALKLPHEHDESVNMTNDKPDPQIVQAYRDLQRGLQDTDRGRSAHETYQKQKR